MTYRSNQVLVRSKSADALVLMHPVMNTHDICQMHSVANVSLTVIALEVNILNMFYISVKQNKSVL